MKSEPRPVGENEAFANGQVKFVRMALFVFVSAFLYLSPVWAEEWRPDLLSWNEVEGEGLDVATYWDTEYVSDHLTYSLPLAMDQEWNLIQQGYRMALGSLSSKRFLNYHQVKLVTDLNESVKFRFSLIEQSDFDHQFSSYFLELAFRLNEYWSWSLFGSPSSHKSEDDVGVALDFSPVGPFKARIFYQAVDFSRNQRNEKADRFVRQPAAYGVLAEQDLGSGWLVKGAWRQEKPMRWKIPEEDRLYDFSRSHWQLKLERLGHEYMDIFMHAHLTKKYESQGSLSAYQISEQAWTDRGGVRWEGQFHAYRLHLGFSYEDRRLKTSTGEVKARDHSPYVWTYLPINNQHWLWAGYEVTYHKGEGPKALRSSLDQNEAYEHRLNWVWEWKPRRSLYLRLLATFDLDHFSKSDAWEGGAGQFMAEF